MCLHLGGDIGGMGLLSYWYRWRCGYYVHASYSPMAHMSCPSVWLSWHSIAPSIFNDGPDLGEFRIIITPHAVAGFLVYVWSDDVMQVLV